MVYQDRFTRRALLRSMSVTGAALLATGQTSSSNATSTGAIDAKLVIAHRGASGYLPEHTLAAKVAAHAMGAHYIEQDVVLTRDDVAVVMHDITLDATTDVSSIFPGRARDDGHHYVVDFDWVELQQLSVYERRGKESAARYPSRFPVEVGPDIFRLHTLQTEIAVIQGMNRSTGRQVGIYTEIKAPRWHAMHDKDIGRIVSGILQDTGYGVEESRIFVQSFDADALQRFGGHHGLTVPLVQLIGENRWWPDDPNDYDAMRTPDGLDEIASYASAIGPWYHQLINDPELVGNAGSRDLRVHTYTLRADQLPDDVGSFDDLLSRLFDMGIDGVFTDFPDQVLAYLGRLSR